jgi:hypothetical protein
MLSAGKGNGPDWLMFQHDTWRQSSLCNYGPVTGIPGSRTSAGPLPGVYPNPSGNSTTIRFSNAEKIRHTLSVYDAEGKTVYKNEKITGEELTLDLAEWKSGIFFFQLQNSAGLISQGKLVVIK